MTCIMSGSHAVPNPPDRLHPTRKLGVIAQLPAEVADMHFHGSLIRHADKGTRVILPEAQPSGQVSLRQHYTSGFHQGAQQFELRSGQVHLGVTGCSCSSGSLQNQAVELQHHARCQRGRDGGRRFLPGAGMASRKHNSLHDGLDWGCGSCRKRGLDCCRGRQ